MSEALRHGRTWDGEPATAAADWLARLQASAMTVEDAEAFDAWLSADASHAEAYDRTFAVLAEIEAAAPAIVEALPHNDNAPSPRRVALRRTWMALGGVAAAAAIALAVTPASVFLPAPTQTYVTAKGEHRTLRLADGSTVEMNAGSTLSVTFDRHVRRLSLPQGEALFDVAADKARPFEIGVGDRTVHVVGTRFDVRHRGADLAVTVERGVVEVRPNAGIAGRVWRLHPGQRLDGAEGVAQVSLSSADPQAVEAWRSGRLIYRDQPLSEVVADLNQQFARPIALDDEALGHVTVSGVLVLDDQDAVIRRLALLAPIKAQPLGQGLVLRREPASRP